jgi:hypothetical protein
VNVVSREFPEGSLVAVFRVNSSDALRLLQLLNRSTRWAESYHRACGTPLKVNDFELSSAAPVVSCHHWSLPINIYRCHMTMKKNADLFEVILILRERQVCQHLVGVVGLRGGRPAWPRPVMFCGVTTYFLM